MQNGLLCFAFAWKIPSVFSILVNSKGKFCYECRISLPRTNRHPVALPLGLALLLDWNIRQTC